MTEQGRSAQYRERGISYDRYGVSLPGPYTQSDASMAGYVFRASGYALQGVVNHYLGADTRHRYFALPLVVLTMVDMPRVFLSENPGLGHMHEIDGGFQIPCISVQRETHELGIALFMPYLWVNTGAAMATGREVLGFHKDVAISFSENDAAVNGAAALTHIRGWVTPAFGDTLQPGMLARILPESEQPGDGSAPASFGGLAQSFLSLVRQALPRVAAAIAAIAPAAGARRVDGEALGQLFSGPDAGGRLSVAFLKQFRDSQNGGGVCHQSVFQAPAKLARTTLQHLGRGRRVAIGNFASHPITDQLGLGKASPGGVYESALTFRVQFDLHMGMQRSEGAARKKVVILGGGPAALAAMMDLSKYPERFDLTLYQMGWRLGGKCASGRGFSSSLAEPGDVAAEWQRNQEHGLHMALGFYENFFDLLRQAYDTLNRSDDWRLRHWTDAVAPRLSYSLEEQRWPRRDRWLELPMLLPTNDLVPGSRARHADASAGRPYLLDGILSFVKSLLGMAARLPARPLGFLRRQLDLGLVSRALQSLHDRGAAWLDEPESHVLELRGALQDQLQPLHDRLESQRAPTAEAHDWPLLSTLAAVELGVRFVCGIGTLLQRRAAFDSLDELEFSAWLDQTLNFPMLPWTRSSAFLRACYLLPFAYQAGDATRPLLAAGAGARGLLRILADYAGAVAYDFRAGMGESVIVPFYQTISRRSPDARFEFFARVRELRTEDGKIAEIRIGRQARTRAGGDYRPLVTVDRIECFPSHPLYDQLEQGEQLKQGHELLPRGYDLESSHTAWPDVETEVLKLGRDFDLVVLAIPPPALVGVTDDLQRASPAWADMLKHVTGVPTIAAQLWLTKTPAELGWTPARGGGDGPSFMLGYAEPLAAAADMSEILSHEPWSSREPRPESVFYLCSPLRVLARAPRPLVPCSEFINQAREAARQQSLDWIQTSLAHLFPHAVDAEGHVQWESFASPVSASGERRFDAQYCRANVGASDLYITCFPGSLKYRLPSAPEGFDNLYLAGDWTRNNVGIGSLEGAILSGRMAARAILGMDYALYGERDPMPWAAAELVQSAT